MTPDLLTPSAFEPQHLPDGVERRRGTRPVRAEDEALRHAAELFRLTYCGYALSTCWLSLNLVLLGITAPGSLVGKGWAVLSAHQQWAAAAIVAASCFLLMLDAALTWVPGSALRHRLTEPSRIWAHFAIAAVWCWLATAVAFDPLGPRSLSGVLAANIAAGMLGAYITGVARNRRGDGNAS